MNASGDACVYDSCALFQIVTFLEFVGVFFVG